MVGALLFALGLVTVATRKNAVGVLMGVELILNGANVNFVALPLVAYNTTTPGAYTALLTQTLAERCYTSGVSAPATPCANRPCISNAFSSAP